MHHYMPARGAGGLLLPGISYGSAGTLLTNSLQMESPPTTYPALVKLKLET